MSQLRQREDGAWILPFDGSRIQRVTWEGERYAILHLGEYEEISMMLPARTPIDGSIREATFTNSGVLRVLLDDGTVLESRCDPKVENWEVRGPNGLFVVAEVGADDVAVWD
jgi:hypothetical protein